MPLGAASSNPVPMSQDAARDRPRWKSCRVDANSAPGEELTGRFRRPRPRSDGAYLHLPVAALHSVSRAVRVRDEASGGRRLHRPQLRRLGLLEGDLNGKLGAFGVEIAQLRSSPELARVQGADSCSTVEGVGFYP